MNRSPRTNNTINIAVVCACIATIGTLFLGLTSSLESNFARQMKTLPTLSFNQTAQDTAKLASTARRAAQHNAHIQAVTSSYTAVERDWSNRVISDDATPNLSARQQLMNAVVEFETTRRREI